MGNFAILAGNIQFYERIFFSVSSLNWCYLEVQFDIVFKDSVTLKLLFGFVPLQYIKHGLLFM